MSRLHRHLPVLNRFSLINEEYPDPDLPEPPAGVAPELEEEPDVEGIDSDWQEELDGVLSEWEDDVIPDWHEQIVDELSEAQEDTDAVAMVGLTLSSVAAMGVLKSAMTKLAGKASTRAVKDMKSQDVELDPIVPSDDVLNGKANALTLYDARRIATSAGFYGMTLNSGAISKDEFEERLRGFLGDMSIAGSRTVLGWALTDVQNATRLLTFSSGPLLDLYASEVLDKNSCTPCNRIDSKWIGSTNDRSIVDRLYPSGFYVNCLGGPRCRGLVVARVRAGEDE